MADEQRRRAENVKFLQEAVTHVLSSYERYEFINILNNFQRKKEVDVLVVSLRELLNSPGKQELIPYLLGILSIREREKFLKLWMKTSSFKVYYADGAPESDAHHLRVEEFSEDKYSSVRSAKSLPLDTRGFPSKQATNTAAWRARRLDLLRAERDGYGASDDARSGKRSERIYNTVPSRIKEHIPKHRINGVKENVLRVEPRNAQPNKQHLFVSPNGLTNKAGHKTNLRSGDIEETNSQLIPLRRDEGERTKRTPRRKGILHKTPTRTVYLTRDKQTNGFGLSIRGGLDHSSGTFVSAVEKGSAADEMGLYVGDQILSLNDRDLKRISHSDVVQMILSSRQLKLELISHQPVREFRPLQTEYQWLDPAGCPCSPPLEFQTSQQPNGHSHKSDMRLLVDDDERKVNLIMDGSNKIGLKIRGGKEYGLGIYVAGVDKGSVAEKAGLMVGDQILDINGTSFLSITHAEAASLIKSSRMMTVTLRDVGKIPFASTVYGKAIHTNNKKSPRDPLDSSRWDEEHLRETGEAIFRQGIAGSQLMHQSVVGVTAHGLIEEQGRLLLTDNELESLKYYVKQYSGAQIDVHGLVLALLHILNTTPKMVLLSDIRSAIHPHDIDAFDEMVLKKELAAQKHRKRTSLTLLQNGHDSNESRKQSLTEERVPVEEEIIVHQHKDVTVQTSLNNIMAALEQESVAEDREKGDVRQSSKEIAKQNFKMSNGSQASDDSGIVTDHMNGIPRKPVVDHTVDPNYEVLSEEGSDSDCNTYYAKTDETRSGYQVTDNCTSSDDNEDAYGVTRSVEIQINHIEKQQDNEVAIVNGVHHEDDVESLEDHINRDESPIEFTSLKLEESVSPDMADLSVLQTIDNLDVNNSYAGEESFQSLCNLTEESPYTQLDSERRYPAPSGLDHLRMALTGAGSDSESEEYAKVQKETISPVKTTGNCTSDLQPALKPEKDMVVQPSNEVLDRPLDSLNTPEPDTEHEATETRIKPSLFLQSSVDEMDTVSADPSYKEDIRTEEEEPQQVQKNKPLFFVPFGFKGGNEKVALEDMMVRNFDDENNGRTTSPIADEIVPITSSPVKETGFVHMDIMQDRSNSPLSLSRSSSGRRQMQEVVDVSTDHEREAVLDTGERRPYSLNPAFSSIMRIPENYITKETKKNSVVVAASGSPTHKQPTALGFHALNKPADMEVLDASVEKNTDYKTIRNFTWKSSISTTYDPNSGVVPTVKSRSQSRSESVEKVTGQMETSSSLDKKSVESEKSETHETEVSVKKIKELFESKSKVSNDDEKKPLKFIRKASSDRLLVTKEKDDIMKPFTEFEFRPSSSDDATESSVAETNNHSFLSQSSIQDLDLISYSGVETDSNNKESEDSLLARRHSQGSIVKIEKSYSQLGLVLEGGMVDGLQILKVKSIQKGKFSAAYAATEDSDLLREGQEILAVDGESLEGLSHSIANLVMRQAYNNPDGRYLELLVKDL